MAGLVWSAFDWQSFSTLTTGFLAVAGAVVVGWRQVGIAERQAASQETQTAILKKQAELAELSLRRELWEKRFEVFSATSAFLLDALDDTYDPQVGIEFLKQSARSEFLFSRAAHTEILAIWNAVGQARVHHQEAQAHLKQSGAYKDGDSERTAILKAKLTKKMNELSEVFGEMRLTDL